MKHFSPKLFLSFLMIIFTNLSYSIIQDYRSELRVLNKELLATSQNGAELLLGRVSVLKQKIRLENERIHSQLLTEQKIYSELFSLTERLNPFDHSSSDWELINIAPKKKKQAELQDLLAQTNMLLNVTKIRAQIIGDPKKCKSKDCTAFISGQSELCSSENCEAYITGDSEKCSSRDCKAFIRSDINKCYTNDCRAYLSGRSDLCSGHDCRAFITGNIKECISGDCVAYLKNDPKECSSCDCKAYLSFKGVGPLLKIKTHKFGLRSHSIPLGVIFSNRLEDDQSETFSVGIAAKNCSPRVEFSERDL